MDVLLLPPELLILVFSGIEVTDLLRCERVCHRWLSLVRGSAALWERKMEDLKKREGPRLDREFREMLPKMYSTAEKIRAAVLRVDANLSALDSNVRSGRARRVSVAADEDAAAFDVDFDHGRIAIYATRASSSSVSVYGLKTLEFLDEMPIDHMTHASASIVKLTGDWLLRVVPVIGDRRMWNWRKKFQVVDLDFKAEKPSPIVSVRNERLVDLVNRRRQIIVWRLTGDDTPASPQFVFEVDSDENLWKDVTHGDFKVFGLESRRSTPTLMLRGFCLVSGYEFVRLELVVDDLRARFHLRYPFVVRHDAEETGVGRLDVAGALFVRAVGPRPLTLVSGDRPQDGRRILIGPDRRLLASFSVFHPELLTLFQFPLGMNPIATDDYFVVAVETFSKRLVVYDFLDLEAETTVESVPRKNTWAELLTRVKAQSHAVSKDPFKLF